MKDSSKLSSLLQKREAENSLRELRQLSADLIDFSSNDYLGLARSLDLKNRIHEQHSAHSDLNGSTGSRLISGNNKLIEGTEQYLAQFFEQESSTIFSSGYMANLAFYSSVPQKGDTILYDELSHVCIKDGCRLSLAKRFSFKHNNLQDLAHKLSKAEGNVYIAVESVYSMDGDLCLLKEICDLAAKHSAFVIVDEAHSTGIWGTQGQGLVQQLGLQNKVSAVIYTFGKAMGIHGACIAGSQNLKSFIINFARPFIYTTAPSNHEIISIQEAFQLRKSDPKPAKELFKLINYFNKKLPASSSASPIKAVTLGGNDQTKNLSNTLQENGLDIRPILSPTVKEGSERLRICLHSFNTQKEIDFLCETLTLNSPKQFS